MKKLSSVSMLCCLVLFVLTAAASRSQQSFSITSSRANNYCNGTCTLLDNPDLNGNPAAIVVITPVEVNGINLNPHPICAYYNGKLWSVFNIDNSTMVPGSQFNVTYYAKPDDSHFVHIVTKENLVKTRSYIDHAGLNENPGAQFQLFQNAAPNVRGGNVNKDEIKTQYDEAAGKWFIAKSNGNTLDLATGYNISISSERNSSSSPITTVRSGTNAPVTVKNPFIPFAATDHSGQQVFITTVGATQGQFTGENGTNKILLAGYEMDLNTARDASSGVATGRRQYSPILFQKAAGAASVQFFKALVTNENLSSVTFEVYEPSSTGSGATVLSYKIVLGGVHVAGFKQSFIEGQKGLVDSIKLVFTSIALTNINGAVTATDTWSGVN